MSKRILILLLIISLVILTFCSKKTTSPEEQLLAPSNLQITLIENNKIQLSWTDNSTNETKFLIARKVGTFNWQENYGEVNANITAFPDEIPTSSDTVFSYRVRAFDGEDYSAYSDTVAWFSDNSAPSNLQLEQIEQDTLQLSWQDNSIGEEYFRIDRKIDEKGWQMDYAHVPADTTNFLDYTTALYDTCNYKIFAVLGISHSDSTENAFIPFLPAPSNLQLQTLGATEVKLTFQDNCHNEEGYRLYVKRGETAVWDSVDFQEYISPAVTITDGNVIPGIVNYYKVCAYYENETSGSIEGNINTLPAPTNLGYYIISTASVKLMWDDNSVCEQGYKIDRKVGEGEWQNEYAILNNNLTNWTDESVDIVDNGYYYRIYSYYENNISSNAELKVYNTFFYTFGGSDGDIGQSVQQTNDNGFIITGSTSSYGAGSLDILIIKIDALGNEEFINTFGGSNDDQGYSIQQTNDNGFIIVGATKSYGCGNYDVWLIKTDAQGNEEWSNTFGESDNDWGHSVQQTNDNGFIITGSTSSYGSPGVHDETDVLLIKTDAQGNEEWVNTFGGYATQRGYSVKQTNDNGFIITGYKIDGSGMSCDVWLIKTDLNGNELWSKTFGGSDYDEGYSVQQTKDNGFIITGRTRSYSVGGYYTDVWLIKTDGMGNEEWNKTFGESEQDEGKSVYQTNDNGFIITGFTKSFGVYSGDVLLIKTDAQGNEEWINTFGGTSSDWGYSVQQTKDNGFIITGSSYISDTSDLLLIKTDNEGNVE